MMFQGTLVSTCDSKPRRGPVKELLTQIQLTVILQSLADKYPE